MKQKFPLFAAFGGRQEFLTAEEAKGASFDRRVRSIWPFVVRSVQSFQLSLTHRDRVNFDAEDTLAELWVALAENDGQWDHERGQYITYAGVVIERELFAIRDKARTVQSPRNTACRLKEYEAEEADGTITARRSKTATDIRRTVAGIRGWRFVAQETGYGTRMIHEEPEADQTPCPDECAAEREMARVSAAALRAAITAALTPEEAGVLGRLAGLWGQEPLSVWRLAFETGADQDEIRRTKVRAWRKVQRYLTAVNHPAAAD